MIPSWFHLLRRHQQRHGQALTLPFLLGALRSPPGKLEPDEGVNFTELRALMISMRDEVPGEYWIRVVECPTLRQPVIYLNSVFYRPMQADLQIQSPVQLRITVAAQVSYATEPAATIDSVAEYIWSLHRSAVIEGRFSYSVVLRRFGEFDFAEMDFIRRALISYSDE